MEERNLEDIEKEIEEKKKAMAEQQAEPTYEVSTQSTEQPLSNTINNRLEEIFQESVNNNSEGVVALADKAVKNEIEIKNDEIEGRKEIRKSEIRKKVTESKTEEDTAKHERAKTILKAQGLTSQLPAAYRITALILGYPFYVLYLLTFGWVVLLLTFVIKGFITMVADCAERFAEVNKKFVENDNEKQFKLGKAIINILKWLLIVGAVTAVVVLFILK